MTKKHALIVEKYLKEFDDLAKHSGDTEVVHVCADNLLLQVVRELGFCQLADAWAKVEKATGGFWYA